MQQVSGFRDGERDYTKLEGDTGPLVYALPYYHTYDKELISDTQLYIYTFTPSSKNSYQPLKLFKSVTPSISS